MFFFLENVWKVLGRRQRENLQKQNKCTFSKDARYKHIWLVSDITQIADPVSVISDQSHGARIPAIIGQRTKVVEVSIPRFNNKGIAVREKT